MFPYSVILLAMAVAIVLDAGINGGCGARRRAIPHPWRVRGVQHPSMLGMLLNTLMVTGSCGAYNATFNRCGRVKGLGFIRMWILQFNVSG